MIPSLRDSQVNAVLRGFLITVLPPGVEVMIGNANRVPEPRGDNFVVFWSSLRKRLGTNVVTWDQSPDGNPASQENTEALRIDMQLDFHGEDSTDNGQVFATLFRSAYAVDYWKQYSITPNYCSDGQMLPFINGEKQYEDRWTIYATFDANITISTPQQFADIVTVGLIEVDEKFPPA